MTDATQTPQQTPPPAPEAPKVAPTGTSGLSLGAALLSAIPGLIAALAGAGWPGVVALVLGGAGLMIGIGYGIARLNQMIDGRDMSRAGADAGTTAVDLANQAAGNRHDMDDIRKDNPPTAQ